MPTGKVWVYRLLLFLFFFRLYVCTVTYFSGKNKASGVKKNLHAGSSAYWAGNLPF